MEKTKSMSSFDIDALLRAVDPESPCGPNLEYDPAFVALELAALGKPEVQYGDSITDAVPPEWKLIKNLSLELLERSRDLRVAMPLLRANLVMHGIPGLADGMQLIERLLEERWDTVHPELDPDDDMDPTLRINSLAALADSATVLKDLKESVLVVLPGLGPLTVRGLEIANGELPPAEGQERIAIASLEAALADVNEIALAESIAALDRAHGSVTAIESLLERQVGNAQALNLDALARLLKRSHSFLAAQYGHRHPNELPITSAPDAGLDPAPGSGTVTPRAAVISGEVASREDVVRMLDKVLKYYKQFEPSSPVPLLLDRAKRLVPKSFMEIMEDLAPDGLAQLLVIQGSQDVAQDD
jgi:type VI secretion system protein ImpA